MAEDTFTGIEVEKLPPELQTIYKSMQADYTRKRQEDANARKEAELRIREYEQNVNDLQTALVSYKQANDRWSEWADTVTKSPSADGLHLGQEDDETFETEIPGRGKVTVQRRPEGEQIAMAQSKKLGELEESIRRLSTALDMSLQINELSRKYPDIDPKKVVQTALELKIPDLEKARDIAYRDDDLKRMVEEQAKQRVEELLQERLNTALDRGEPGLSLPKLPEDMSKVRQFGQDSEEILANIRSSLSKI